MFRRAAPAPSARPAETRRAGSASDGLYSGAARMASPVTASSTGAVRSGGLKCRACHCTAILRLPTPRKPPKSMTAARGWPSWFDQHVDHHAHVLAGRPVDLLAEDAWPPRRSGVGPAGFSAGGSGAASSPPATSAAGCSGGHRPRRRGPGRAAAASAGGRDVALRRGLGGGGGWGCVGRCVVVGRRARGRAGQQKQRAGSGERAGSSARSLTKLWPPRAGGGTSGCRCRCAPGARPTTRPRRSSPTRAR